MKKPIILGEDVSKINGQKLFFSNASDFRFRLKDLAHVFNYLSKRFDETYTVCISNESFLYSDSSKIYKIANVFIKIDEEAKRVILY